MSTGESINAGTVVGSIRIDASQASTGASQFQNSLGLLNKTVTENWWGLYSIGQTLGTIGGLATAAFSEAAGAAGAWQAQMAELNTTLNGAASGTQASQDQIQGLSDKLLQLAASTPTSVEGIAAIANEVAKVGVTGDNIVSVTQDVNDLHNTTGASVADMTESIGRLTATWGLNADGVQRVTSTIFDLSRQTPSTATDIGIVAEKLDGLTNAYGLTKAEVLGLSSAVATVAPNNRTAATAMQSLFQTIQKAVDGGSASVTNFAALAGESADQFIKAFGSGGSGATDTIVRFATGLGQFGAQGGNVATLLDTLGLKGNSVQQILNALAEAQTSASGSSASLSSQLEIASNAFAKGNDLLTAAQTQYSTYQARTEEAKNAVTELGISVGNVFLPPLKDTISLLTDWVKHITDLPGPIRDVVVGLAALATAATVAAAAAFTILPQLIQARAAYDALRNAATAYQQAQREAAADILAQTGYYNDLLTVSDELLVSTNSFIDSLNEEAVASARAAIELNNLTKLEQSLNDLHAAEIESEANLTKTTEAQTLAYAEQEAAVDALAAKATSLNSLTRNQLVSQASAAGVEGATKQTKPQLIATLTEDDASAATTATSANTAATEANVAAKEQVVAVNQQLTDTTLAFDLAQAQATASGNAFTTSVEADAASLFTLNTALDETDAAFTAFAETVESESATVTEEVVAGNAAMLASFAALVEEYEASATAFGETATTLGGEVSAEVAAETAQQAAAAIQIAQALDEEAVSYQRTADAAIAAAEEKRTALLQQTEALDATVAQYEAIAADETASQEEIAAAYEAVTEQIVTTLAAREEAASSAAIAVAAGAALEGAAEDAAAAATVAASATIDAALASVAVEEDVVTEGASILPQIIALVVGAAVVAAPIILTLSGALDKAAKSTQDLSQASQQLESILEASNGAVTEASEKFVNNELAQNGALDAAQKLGIGYKELGDIVSGVASKSELDDFIAKTNDGGKAGANLKTVIDALAQSYYNSAAAAREAAGANAADGIASQDSAAQIEQLASATDASGNSLDKMATAAVSLIDSEEKLKEASVAIADAQTALNTAIEKQQNQWEDVAKASIDYQKALLDQQKVQQKLADDEVTLSNATATQAKETADAQKALDDANTKAADSANKVAVAQDALNKAEDPTVALNAYLDAVNKLANAQISLRDATATVANAQYQVNYLQKEGASQADIAAAQLKLADATQKQTDAQQSIADATQNVTDVQVANADKVKTAEDNLTSALQDQQNAIQAVQDAQDKLNVAQQDAAANKDYNEALQAVESDQLDVQSAALASYDAQGKLNDAQNEGASLADAVAKATDGVTNAQLNYASAYAKTQQDIAEAAGKPWTAVDSANAYLQALNQIGTSGTAPVQSFASQLTPILNGINGQLNQAIANAQVPPTADDLANAQKNLNDLNKSTDEQTKKNTSYWSIAWDLIKQYARDAWQWIDSDFLHPIGSGFVTAWNAVDDNFIHPIGHFLTVDIPTWATEGWQAVDNNFFHPIGSFATSVWNGFRNDIVDPIEHFFTVDLGNWVLQGIGWLEGIPGDIGKFATGMWDGISGAFKTAINDIIGLWDGFVKYLKIPAFTVGVGPISYHFGGWDLGSQLQIPYLAEGGVVPATQGGRLIVAGEGGEDEAIVPLSKLRDLIQQYAEQNITASTLPDTSFNTGAGSNVGTTQAAANYVAVQTSVAQAVQQLTATNALTTALTTQTSLKQASAATEAARHTEWVAVATKLDTSITALTQAVNALEAGDSYEFHEVQASAQAIMQEISWVKRINTRS